MMPNVDAVETEVLRNKLVSIVYEMGAVLRRTAYSPNIREREDCSCVITDPKGQILAQAEHIPGHLGILAVGVPYLLDYFPIETWREGDVLMFNTPEGGSHLPDIRIVVPVFRDGEIIALCANMAHHADVGGMVPGSMPSTSTEVWQEGLILPPLKLYSEGVLNKAVIDILMRNVRTPDEREGDLNSQIAAAQLGQRRLSEVVEGVGIEDYQLYSEEIMNYSERLMRARIKEVLPDGTYYSEQFIDNDGLTDELIKIAATITIKDDNVKVDFTGTDPQRESGVNCILANCISASYFVIKACADPTIPVNAGCYRPIDVYCPEGTIISPDPYAAIGAGNETWQRIAETLIGALLTADPKLVKAHSHGCMNNIVFGGKDPRDGGRYSYYETIGGGDGARYTADGMDGVHVLGTNTMNTPAEVVEMYYPLRIEEYNLIPDSGGAGLYRGGVGIKRKFRVIGHGSTLTANTDWMKQKPDGTEGGGRGAMTRMVFNEGTPQEEEANMCKVMRILKDGETFSIYSGGGNGYGSPLDRAPEKIHQDLLDEKLSRECASELYGSEG
jgi:N-methylhydantoinase B